MIRTLAVARCRHAVAALWLASVACSAPAQVVSGSAAADAPAEIALVLPNQETVFAQAAEAVRQGFFAAHEAGGKAPAIQVIEVGDDLDQLFMAIAGAQQRGVKVVVGPLPRSAVNALVDGGRATLPMVVLNYPERDAGAPGTLVALGLSAESEAQYVVRVALAEFVGTRRAVAAAPRFVVLSGQGALERRIGQAYVSALRAAGEAPLLIELTPETRHQFARHIDAGRHDAVFLALDARETALVRARIPRAILVFGTSLLNAGGIGTPEAVALAHDLDGVRFVDMPWLLRPNGAPANGPVPVVPLATDLARLFALGVDAYQVALRWSRGETRFVIDGMTGRLRIDRTEGPRVERTPAAAIYRNGAVEREEIGR